MIAFPNFYFRFLLYIKSCFFYFYFHLKYVWTPLATNPLPLLYLGLFTTGVCNYLQTIGQKDIPAERAAIIYSMDPVYAGTCCVVFCRVMLHCAQFA